MCVDVNWWMKEETPQTANGHSQLQHILALAREGTPRTWLSSAPAFASSTPSEHGHLNRQESHCVRF